uniref:Uncharacterized protein n=1 Tax=Moniliophthora roreri TaxID=221103 RepID=A0A0W0FUQ5_MONRR
MSLPLTPQAPVATNAIPLLMDSIPMSPSERTPAEQPAVLSTDLNVLSNASRNQKSQGIELNVDMAGTETAPLTKCHVSNGANALEGQNMVSLSSASGGPANTSSQGSPLKSVYGAPLPNTKLAPVPEYTDAQLKAMTLEECKAHLKKAIKGFLFWHQGNLKKKKGDLELSKLFQNLHTQLLPHKCQLTHFLMMHPKYKENIKNRSTETLTKDRLKSCKKAAKALIKELESEGKLEAVIQERDQEHADVMEVWKSQAQEQVDSCHASIGSVIQPILNWLHEETGLYFILLAGEDVDGKGNFNSIVATSYPDKYVPIDKFHIADFKSIVQVFYRWLQMVCKNRDGIVQEIAFDLQNEHTISSAIQKTPSTSTSVQSSTSILMTATSSNLPSTKSAIKKGTTKKGKGTLVDWAKRGRKDSKMKAGNYNKQQGVNMAENAQLLKALIACYPDISVNKKGLPMFLPLLKMEQEKATWAAKTAATKAKCKAEKLAVSATPQNNEPLQCSSRKKNVVQTYREKLEDVGTEINDSSHPNAMNMAINVNAAQATSDSDRSSAVGSTALGEQCALDDNGNLKDLKDIVWFHNPDDKEPILRWDNIPVPSTAANTMEGQNRKKDERKVLIQNYLKFLLTVPNGCDMRPEC